ncbi:sensor histidine kinase [Taibaiella koreensis]|uniref:sensor histidine kinase n=1 Tax=Taibaiella koreensis TaxID=1268548 RepID=UPI0013C2E798|nr:ATP-binding protein [Taibaiella koreensis]
MQDEELRGQQAVFNALQEGQERERSRLAEELHDGVGARLSGLKMTTEHLKLVATENVELIGKVYTGISETLEEVREISHNLLPYFVNGKDMEQLLSDRIQGLNATGQCNYSLLINGQLSSLDKTIQLHVFRMISELLTNVQRHAQASLASVQINRDDDMLGIVVEDNGVGMPAQRSGKEGIGLTTVSSRVSVCKGTITTDSSPKGTCVIIEIPVNPLV